MATRRRRRRTRSNAKKTRSNAKGFLKSFLTPLGNLLKLGIGYVGSSAVATKLKEIFNIKEGGGLVNAGIGTIVPILLDRFGFGLKLPKTVIYGMYMTGLDGIATITANFGKQKFIFDQDSGNWIKNSNYNYQDVSIKDWLVGLISGNDYSGKAGGFGQQNEPVMVVDDYGQIQYLYPNQINPYQQQLPAYTNNPYLSGDDTGIFDAEIEDDIDSLFGDEEAYELDKEELRLNGDDEEAYSLSKDDLRF